MTDTPKDAFDALEYPCDYLFKAICKTADGLQQSLIQQIRDTFVDMPITNVTDRPSKNGRFTSVSFEAHINSREQLESVYQALAASEHVVMTL